MTTAKGKSKSKIFKSKKNHPINEIVHWILPYDNDKLEQDALAELIAIGYAPTGEENPKKLLRKISDFVIDAMVSNLKEFFKLPLLKLVIPLIWIEWCYRNKCLKNDWEWYWDSSIEGHLVFDPSVDLKYPSF